MVTSLVYPPESTFKYIDHHQPSVTSPTTIMDSSTFITPRLLSVFLEHKDKWFTRKELAVLIGSRNYERVGMHLGVLEQEGKIISKADDRVPFFRKIYQFNGGKKK